MLGYYLLYLYFYLYPFWNKISLLCCIEVGFWPNNALFEGFGDSNLVYGLIKSHLTVFIIVFITYLL